MPRTEMYNCIEFWLVLTIHHKQIVKHKIMKLFCIIKQAGMTLEKKDNKKIILKCRYKIFSVILIVTSWLYIYFCKCYSLRKIYSAVSRVENTRFLSLYDIAEICNWTSNEAMMIWENSFTIIVRNSFFFCFL